MSVKGGSLSLHCSVTEAACLSMYAVVLLASWLANGCAGVLLSLVLETDLT